ncbi:pyridine nucleotide transhydrogenase [Candidatus Marinimicrobia bacterium]|nr:pyridine nucleotide transhydrogenase [Candidatus Neomarinimicrobiota bacterium]
MKNALIGNTGFVGSSLSKQYSFNFFYNSKNINQIKNKKFDMVICAGAPGKKWLANQNPSADLESINNLILNLKTIDCKKIVLISTVDVFSIPKNVNENTVVNKKKLLPYGLHRRILEEFVENHFKDFTIVRLPGLVGSGLQKNIIYDFLNKNNLNLIDTRNIYQFYATSNLMRDIKIALKNNLKLIHLTAEPISVKEVAEKGFDLNFENITKNSITEYSFETVYSNLFNGIGKYQYSKKDCILSIREYAKSEK